MKTNYPTKKLGEVCEIITGNTPRTAITDYYGDSYMWAGPSDLKNNKYILKTKKKLSEKGFNESGIRKVPAGSVLMSCIGNVGKLGIAIETMSSNQQINTFVPNLNILDSDYLYYVLQTKVKEFQLASSKTTLPIINKTKCSNINIPLPPLEEQKKIVKVLEEKLDKVREAIKLREEAIADTEKITPANLTEILENLDGEIVTIKDVAQVKTGGTPSKSNTKYWNGDIPWVSPKDMKSWIIEDAIDHVSDAAVQESSTNLVPENTILVVVRSGILKHTLPVSITNRAVTFNQDIKAIIPDLNLILPVYLAYWIKGFESLILKEGIKKGVTVQSFEGKYLENFQIKLPNLKTQETIVKELDELSQKVTELRNLQESQLADLKALEQAYLREAFNGELI